MNADNSHPLDYATPPKVRVWPVWVHVIILFIWPLLVVCIWGMALICPVVAAAEIINLIHPIPGLQVHNHHLTVTSGEKWRWIVYTSAMSAVFISLARWHVNWRSRDVSDEKMQPK